MGKGFIGYMSQLLHQSFRVLPSNDRNQRPAPVARRVRTQLPCRGSAVRSIAWFGLFILSHGIVITSRGLGIYSEVPHKCIHDEDSADDHHNNGYKSTYEAVVLPIDRVHGGGSCIPETVSEV
jgi:hypothetical protein